MRSFASKHQGVNWFLIASLVLPIAFSPAHGSPQFITQWGSNGAGPGQWGAAFSCAVDDSLHVYVVDESHHRVEKFSSTGTFLMQWGTQGSGPGQFNFPGNVAVDHAFNVYVTDFGNDRVEKFSSVGVFLTTWGTTGGLDGQFREPTGIAVDSVANVYVVDKGVETLPEGFENHRIEKFSSSGVFLAKWGSLGAGDDQFQVPTDVAVSGAGTVYVTDPDRHFVTAWTDGGTFIRRWGGIGSGPGQFINCSGIAVDRRDGNRVYVSDGNGDRIQEFQPDGTFADVWGTSGSGPGQFASAQGISIDRTGFIYVIDQGNFRLQKFLRTDLVGVERSHASGVEIAAWPNPSHDQAVVRVTLPSEERVSIDVWDVAGRRARAIVAARWAAGEHSTQWDLRNDAGRRVEPGLYVIRLATPHYGAQSRVLVLR